MMFPILLALLATALLQVAEAGPAQSPAQAAMTSKRIALSFDDAPRGDGWAHTGEERTAALVEALERAEVTGAVFFVTTGNLEQAGVEGARRLRRYVDAGHVLASHSHAHRSANRISPEAFLTDLDRSLERLGSFDAVLPWFRFPFLHEGASAAARDAVREGLAERGLANGYVTVDNYDYYLEALAREAVEAGHPIDRQQLRDTYVEILLEAVEFYDAIALEALGRSPAHVLLLHENDVAALYVDDLVTALRARGWEIISAAEAYRDPIAQVQPDTLFLNQGRVAAIANVAGRVRRELVHPAEDEAWLRRLFVQRGLLPADGSD